MARSRPAPSGPTAPPTYDVYFGMLVVTVLSMLVGIGVLVVEGGEYDWVQKPAATPAVAIPPVPPPGGPGPGPGPSPGPGPGPGAPPRPPARAPGL